MKVLDVFKHRYVYFAISIVIILTSVVLAFTNGIKLDITFQGGSILKYTYTGTIDTEEAASLVQSAIDKPTSCQKQTASDNQILIVNLANRQSITSEEQATVTSTLMDAYPDANIALYESLSVQPFTGARFFRNGILAICLSFFLILIYVAFRFKKIGGFSAGFMAIVALLHDACIVTAVFIVFQIPLNDAFIAAILTIIGYSINDTIVIYDRVRENTLIMGSKTSTVELINTSITQTLARSINTTVTVFLCITIVYVYALVYNIESIKNFALPLMFGVVSGCYSTICIAVPLWTMWKNRGDTPKAKKA